MDVDGARPRAAPSGIEVDRVGEVLLLDLLLFYLEHAELAQVTVLEVQVFHELECLRLGSDRELTEERWA